MKAVIMVGLGLLSGAVSGAEPEALPRVLILGDSVYQQPAAEMAKALKGQVEIVYGSMPPGEPRNSTAALGNLDLILGEGRWNLIHFNFGLGDLVHRAPAMNSFRALPKTAGGVRATSQEQYGKNLQELVKRLKATGARLVWASTTPIGGSSNGLFEKGSEVEYNAVAAAIMKAQGVPINDMHSYVLSVTDMQKSNDPFSFNRQPLSPPIVEIILQQLDLP